MSNKTVDINNALTHDTQAIIDIMPGFFCITDEHSRYLTANTRLSNCFGFSSTDQMIGLTYSQIKCRAADIADQWIQEDTLTLESNESNKFVSYACTANDTWRLVIGEKKPFTNSHNQPGLMMHFLELTHLGVLDVFPWLKKQNGFPIKEQFSAQLVKQSPSPTQEPFSSLESECLFFLLRGKTLRQMGELLALSVSAVEKLVYRLKCQFNCFNKSELIAAAIDGGYLNMIPETLFYSASRAQHGLHNDKTTRLP